MNFVVTAKARSAIRHYLKGLRRSEAIELGQRLLSQALAEFQLTLERVEDEAFATALGELGLATRDELFEKVGLGERLAPLVARRLLPLASAEKAEGTRAPLAVAGTEGLLVSYARCCFPVPDDPIIAFLSTGRGIVVHRETCANVDDYRKHPENWLSVAWEPGLTRTFTSQLRVSVANKMGVLAAIAAAIADAEANIDQVEVEERDRETSELVFEIKIKDRRQLARIIRLLRRMPQVLRVVRTLQQHETD
jgi:(p)ppGpp synthase/HD superfamily hydrolase